MSVSQYTSLPAFVVRPFDPENPYAQYRELTADEQRAIRDGSGIGSLATLQACVSDENIPAERSLIEPIYSRCEEDNQKWTIYANEEGQIYNQPLNAAASMILGQSIVGPVVFYPAEWTNYGE